MYSFEIIEEGDSNETDFTLHVGTLKNLDNALLFFSLDKILESLKRHVGCRSIKIKMDTQNIENKDSVIHFTASYEYQPFPTYKNAKTRAEFYPSRSNFYLRYWKILPDKIPVIETYLTNDSGLIRGMAKQMIKDSQ